MFSFIDTRQGLVYRPLYLGMYVTTICVYVASCKHVARLLFN